MNIATEVQIALIAAILILALVLIFKNRVAQVIFGPAKMILFNPKEQQEAAEKAKEIVEKEATTTSPDTKPQWQKVATLFWLGNDLMWITDMIYRGALPERVLQGVKYTRQYLLDLGFLKDSFPLQQLTIASDILESVVGITGATSTERSLLKQHYTSVAKQVQSIKWYISALAEQEQPGFQKLRAL